MDGKMFNDDDTAQMTAHGITPKEAERQVDLFKTARSYLKLVGPCVPGEGIAVFSREEQKALTALYERERQKRFCLKFVPASGAASRMFKVLSAYLNQAGEIERDAVSRKAAAGKADAGQLLVFMEGISRNSLFFMICRSALLRKRPIPRRIVGDQGRFREIIRLLLKEEGLNYAGLPKGLLMFHGYPEGNRTAFEEHLVEAVAYARDAEGRCPMHFTVSPEHLKRFEACLHRN